MAELFSALPPLEAFKLLAPLLPTIRKSTSGRPRAWRSTTSLARTFLGRRQLPEEEEALPSKCGRLLCTILGTRDTSNTWHSDSTEHLEAADFVGGKASPATFKCAGLGSIRALAHGDDFAILADDDGLAFWERMLHERYQCKCAGRLGGGASGSAECLCLNRVVRVRGTEDAARTEIELDARHMEVALNDLGLSGGDSVTTPEVKVGPRVLHIHHDNTWPQLQIAANPLKSYQVRRIQTHHAAINDLTASARSGRSCAK